MKEMISDVYLGQKISDYLFIKSCNGKLSQIRNIYRFECYSEIAKSRLKQRIIKSKMMDYRPVVKTIIKSAYVDEIENVIISNDSIKIFESIDFNKLKSKLGISATLSQNKLFLNGDNPIILARFILFVVCDFIDLSSNFEVKLTMNILEYCLGWFDKKIEFNRSLDYLNLSAPVAELSDICGVNALGDSFICQPYRSDIVVISTIIGDLFSADIAFFSDLNKANKQTASLTSNDFDYIEAIQNGLNYLGYTYSKIDKSFQNEDEQIVVSDKKMRNISYAHKFYDVCENSIGLFDGVIIWYSGYNIDINSFAEDIRRLVDLSLKKTLSWNFCGPEIIGRWGECVVAQIHLIDAELIHKHNTNCYLIATAHIDIK